MGLLYKWTTRSSALIAAAVLAACGGGSSTTADTTAQTAAITQGNYTNYAKPMGASVVGMNGSSAATGAFGGTGTGASAAGVLAWARQVRLAGHAVAMSVDPRAHAQAAGSISSACPYGGSMTGSANYANASSITKGDSATVTFSNCVEESGGVPLSGGMSLTFNAYSANPLLLDVSGSFTNLSAGTPALDGSFQMTLAQTGTAETLHMGFSGMKIGSDPTTYDTTLDATVASSGSVTFSLGGSITTADGHYTLSQVTPFSANGGDPVAGVLRLSDPKGNAVQMTANADGTVVFAYYPSGATAPSATSSTYSWAQFKQ